MPWFRLLPSLSNSSTKQRWAEKLLNIIIVSQVINPLHCTGYNPKALVLVPKNIGFVGAISTAIANVFKVTHWTMCMAYPGHHHPCDLQAHLKKDKAHHLHSCVVLAFSNGVIYLRLIYWINLTAKLNELTTLVWSSTTLAQLASWVWCLDLGMHHFDWSIPSWVAMLLNMFIFHGFWHILKVELQIIAAGALYVWRRCLDLHRPGQIENWRRWYVKCHFDMIAPLTSLNTLAWKKVSRLRSRATASKCALYWRVISNRSKGSLARMANKLWTKKMSTALLLHLDSP